MTNQPLVLYYDLATAKTRAAALPDCVNEDAQSFLFRGARFTYVGCGLDFWDYLVMPNEDIVGVVLISFDVDEFLASSPMLTRAANVSRDEDEYGYHILLTAVDVQPEIDGAQAFGCSLFQNSKDCVLLLTDWHRRGYAFPMDSGLIEATRR